MTLSWIKNTFSPKPLLKKIVKSDGFIHGVARLAWLYIKTVEKTSSFTILNEDRIKKYVDNNTPVIVAFWHNRLFLNALGWSYQAPFYMLISKHSDGQLISRVMDCFNIQTIEGSTNKEGAGALRSLLKTLKTGGYVGITPDGPRGPRFSISDGTIALARLSGVDVIPGMSACKRRKVLGSWDRFIFALPFSKLAFNWGEPVSIPKKATEDDIKIFREKLYKNMMAAADEADAFCGHKPFLEITAEEASS